MLVALDLRVLILPQAESVVKEQLSALKKLWIWSCRSGRVDLPADFAVMEAQHRAVIETLTAAMAELRSEFKRRWEDQQRGTVMKDLLTMSRFYEGNEAIATATTTPPPPPHHHHRMMASEKGGGVTPLGAKLEKTFSHVACEFTL